MRFAGSGVVELLLALDIGNTATTVGVWRDLELLGPWRLSTHRAGTADELGMVLRSLLTSADLQPGQIRGMVVSCVVPPVVQTVEEMARRIFSIEPLFVGPGIKTGIPIKTDNPLEVGADRIANAVAAFARHGGPIVVVDFGTATTFDAISGQGEYLGGVIAPGVGIAAEALFSRAAKLPRVEIRAPARVIGRNTVASMQSGLVFGYAGLVDGLVSRMVTELSPPAGRGVKVIGTGGHVQAVARECQTLEDVAPDLTLDGLRRLWDRNLPG